MKYLISAATVAALAFICSPVQAEPPAKGCPKVNSADALGDLSQKCARDLSLDANCRAHVRDASEDYVVIKDCSPMKPQGYLMIPVKPVTDTLPEEISQPPLVNLWEDAWLWSEKYPGWPDARMGLALNSKNARSQNQLHIHVSCVVPEVSEALESANIPFYPAQAVTVTLGENNYKALKVKSLNGENSPFAVIHSMQGVAENRKDQGIAVIGSRSLSEYYVLGTTANGPGSGHAEELLDQHCK